MLGCRSEYQIQLRHEIILTRYDLDIKLNGEVYFSTAEKM